MDLMFHAPYILRDVLLILAAALALTVLAAARRRDWRHARVSVPLLAGLALLAAGGLSLTQTVPNAHAADMALGLGAALLTAGALVILRTFLGPPIARGLETRA